MFNVGPGEVILVAIVLLIAVGPEQLPGVIRRAGRAMSQVRNMTEGLRSDFMAGMDEIEKATDVTAWSQEAVTPSPKPEPEDSEPADSAVSSDADSAVSSDADSAVSSDAETIEPPEAETKKPTPPVSKNAIAEAARSNGTPAPLPPPTGDTEANGAEAEDVINTSNGEEGQDREDQSAEADPEPSRDGDETEVEGRS